MLTYTGRLGANHDIMFSVDYDAYDGERWGYRWTIAHRETAFGYAPSKLQTGTDLHSGACSEDNPDTLSRMLGTLLSFVGAYLEALDYESRTGEESENGRLFNAKVASALSESSSDEVAMWAMEVEGER